MNSDPSEPDDRTVVGRPNGAPGAGPPDGIRSSGPADVAATGAGRTAESDKLPTGTRLGEFEVMGVVGEGGFSVVYLAWDHSLERRVALKEYMPSALARRGGAAQVGARSERHRETFEAGLRSFVNEGRLLAQFDHPALIKVYRFWEANGTAYMAMPYYEGVTLKDAVRAMAQAPDEAWLRSVLGPLTEALLVLHRERCFHRDIAPDNVLLLKQGGKPLLLDFGAARRVISDKTQALTVILKPGYAPLEQYAEDNSSKQGTWTDVYALAATTYWAITGRTPPPSVARLLSDAYVPLSVSRAGRYSERFLRAIDRALIVLPADRTQTIEDFRRELGIDDAAAGRRASEDTQADPEATVIRVIPQAADAAQPAAPLDARDVSTPTNTAAGAGLAGIQQSPAGLPGARQHPWETASQTMADAVPSGQPNARPAHPARSPRTAAWVAFVTAMVVIAAGTAWWILRPSLPPPDGSRETLDATSVPARTGAAGDVSSSVSTRPPAGTADEPVPAVAASSTPAPGGADTEARSAPAASPHERAPEPVPLKAPSARVESANPARKPPARRDDASESRSVPASDPVDRSRKGGPAGRESDCAEIYQRLSLGESSPELLARISTLKCR